MLASGHILHNLLTVEVAKRCQHKHRNHEVDQHNPGRYDSHPEYGARPFLHHEQADAESCDAKADDNEGRYKDGAHKHDEEANVALANAAAEPRAMVVKSFNTMITIRTV